MANINWTAAREILGNCDGWTFIDHNGSAYQLDEVICDQASRTVVIYFTENGTRKQIEAEGAPALVETTGEPAYEIIGVLDEGGTKRKPLKVRFVHAERAYAQTVAATKRLQAAMAQLDAALISLSDESVVVVMNNHQGIRYTADNVLTIGTQVIELRRVAEEVSVDASYKVSDNKKPTITDRLYSAMKQVGAIGINVSHRGVKIRFGHRPSIGITSDGNVKLGREVFKPHGREPITVRKEQ